MTRFLKGSAPLGLSSADVSATTRNALVFAAACAMPYLSNAIQISDLSTTQGLIVAALCSVALDLGHKYVSDTR